MTSSSQFVDPEFQYESFRNEDKIFALQRGGSCVASADGAFPNYRLPPRGSGAGTAPCGAAQAAEPAGVAGGKDGAAAHGSADARCVASPPPAHTQAHGPPSSSLQQSHLLNFGTANLSLRVSSGPRHSHHLSRPYSIYDLPRCAFIQHCQAASRLGSAVSAAILFRTPKMGSTGSDRRRSPLVRHEETDSQIMVFNMGSFSAADAIVLCIYSAQTR